MSIGCNIIRMLQNNKQFWFSLFKFADLMKKFKKSYGSYIGFLFLLIFTVAIVPFDFHHRHSEAKEVCNDSGKDGKCAHRLHVSEKSKSCFACAAHFNKTFTQPGLSESLTSFPAISLLTENRVTGYLIKLVFTALRGPPSE